MASIDDLLDASRVRLEWYRSQLARGLPLYKAAEHIASLHAVRILWLDYNLLLWGLPYEQLRPGQQPRDIAEGPIGKRDFLALHGMPLHEGARNIREAFFTCWKAQGAMPGHAYEWSYVQPCTTNEAALTSQADAINAQTLERLASTR